MDHTLGPNVEPVVRDEASDLNRILNCVVAGVSYEDDLTMTLTLFNPAAGEYYKLEVKVDGQYCDDFWLAYSVERID